MLVDNILAPILLFAVTLQFMITKLALSNSGKLQGRSTGTLLKSAVGILTARCRQALWDDLCLPCRGGRSYHCCHDLLLSSDDIHVSSFWWYCFHYQTTNSLDTSRKPLISIFPSRAASCLQCHAVTSNKEILTGFPYRTEWNICGLKRCVTRVCSMYANFALW